MKYIGIILLALTLTACGASKKRSSNLGGNTVEVSKGMTVADLQEQLETTSEWKTLRIKGDAAYKDENTSQSLGMEIRMKKGEIILVSAKIGPITMAKALITPQNVKYYERISSTYFEGDFKFLSKFLGTDLSYEKVEALLLGQVDWKAAKKGKLTITDKQWKAVWKENTTTEGSYIWNALSAMLEQHHYQQSNRNMQVSYSNHAAFDKWVFPQHVFVAATHTDGKNEIELKYSQLTINPEVNFPYEVPSGFDRVYIDSNNTP